MVIRVLDHVDQCYTAADGNVIAKVIRAGLADGGTARVSFSGVNNAPSSFINAALIGLLDTYSYDYIRAHLRILAATPQINDVIRRRFATEAASAHAA